MAKRRSGASTKSEPPPATKSSASHIGLATAVVGLASAVIGLIVALNKLPASGPAEAVSVHAESEAVSTPVDVPAVVSQTPPGFRQQYAAVPQDRVQYIFDSAQAMAVSGTENVSEVAPTADVIAKDLAGYCGGLADSLMALAPGATEDEQAQLLEDAASQYTRVLRTLTALKLRGDARSDPYNSVVAILTDPSTGPLVLVGDPREVRKFHAAVTQALQQCIGVVQEVR